MRLTSCSRWLCTVGGLIMTFSSITMPGSIKDNLQYVAALYEEFLAELKKC